MMNVSQCNHIRIRDDNVYGFNAEQFIKNIEKKHNIDFRSLPQWKDLIQRLHVSTTDYKRKIQVANLRKLCIINKLYTQFTRPSPFELTEKLARTCEKWQYLGRQKTIKLKLQSHTDFGTSIKSEGTQYEMTESSFTIHPNTEIVEAEIVSTDIALKSDAMPDAKLSEPSHLPVNICVNQHKYISPLTSRDFVLEAKVSNMKTKNTAEIQSKESMAKNNTTISSSPKEIYITKETLEEQTIKFSIVNRALEYMHIRFLRIIDETPFKKVEIIPPAPQKLYPGLLVSFKLVFKLKNYSQNFKSALYFKIGKNVLFEAPVEGFIIPVIGKFKQDRLISVTETVQIPPVYLWQIRQDSGFPSAIVHIAVLDNHAYHLHISKHAIDITQEFRDSFVSLEVLSSTTGSFNERIEDADVVEQTKTLASQIEDFHEEIITTLDIIEVLLEDILDLALDTFVFNHIYLYLDPKSKQTIGLSFTKPIRIGSHHCYYNFDFHDTVTNDVVIRKTIKVFAEILPHPVQIYPSILDMSLSPVIHGFCEDKIIVTNTHKIYPVTIKIKLTTKMKKLFSVNPMVRFIPAASSAIIGVKLCSKEAYSGNLEELAYFTFKIIVIGDKRIYKNVPPFFYELIVPCASLFKKVYNDKYFSDVVIDVDPKEISI